MFYSDDDKYNYINYGLNTYDFSFSFLFDENNNENSTEGSDKSEIPEKEDNKYDNYIIYNEPSSLCLDNENKQNKYHEIQTFDVRTLKLEQNLNILTRNEKLKNIINKKIINNNRAILKNSINKWLTKAIIQNIHLNTLNNLLISEEDNEKENIIISEEERKNYLLQKKRKEKNKFKHVNTIRKSKNLVLDNILNFINNIIKKFNNNKIGDGIFIKQFKPLNGMQKSELNVKYNKEFLNKTLKDILSENICGKFNNIPKDHNKKLVEDLLNGKDKDYFTNLFNLTFFECLEHFRGSKFYKELEGLEKEYKNVIKGLRAIGESEDYIEVFEDFVNRFEDYYENKKSRNTKTRTKTTKSDDN